MTIIQKLFIVDFLKALVQVYCFKTRKSHFALVSTAGEDRRSYVGDSVCRTHLFQKLAADWLLERQLRIAAWE